MPTGTTVSPMRPLFVISGQLDFSEATADLSGVISALLDSVCEALSLDERVAEDKDLQAHKYSDSFREICRSRGRSIPSPF